MADIRSIDDYSDELMKMYMKNKDADIAPANPVKKDDSAAKEIKTEQEAELFQQNLQTENEEPFFGDDILPPADDADRSVCRLSSADNEFGFLQVMTTTARTAMPVENAAVTIVCMRNGKYNLVGTYLTDNSGQTELIKLPSEDKAATSAPDMAAEPYYYNITAKKDGYYDYESRDVRIFSGITSLQSFELIPLPLHLNETTENQR